MKTVFPHSCKPCDRDFQSVVDANFAQYSNKGCICAFYDVARLPGEKYLRALNRNPISFSAVTQDPQMVMPNKIVEYINSNEFKSLAVH